MSEYAEVENEEVYNARMARSMQDKLFWVDKVGEPDSIMDCGCGDGTLLERISEWFPEAGLLGCDHDPEMREKAAEKGFTIVPQLRNVGAYEDSCVILSSVLHEVYHYGTPQRIDEFWEGVFDFKKIVIRDMIPSESIERQPDPTDVKKIHHAFKDRKELVDFERRWGSVRNSHKQLVHFLLKYQYTEPNWEREVRENYLPLYYEELLRLIPEEYKIMYNHQYVLPYTRRKVMEDFGIDLTTPTHCKIILEKRSGRL